MKVGDKVIVPGQMTGVVVCDIDNGEYSDENPAAHWAYLKTGIVVDTKEAGRIHYPDARDVTKISISGGNETPGVTRAWQ